MKLLSTTQAAEVLGVNDSRVRQLIREGQLQALQAGRAYLLDESIVQAFQRPPMGRPKKDSEALRAAEAMAGPTRKTPTKRLTAQKTLTSQRNCWLKEMPGTRAAKKGATK